DAHDHGLGYDKNGRVGFFRYFRPAGLPQTITYPFNTNLADPTTPINYNNPLFSPTTGSARSINRLNGIAQALLPGNISDNGLDPDSRDVAVMGAMPFDWKNDTTPI